MNMNKEDKEEWISLMKKGFVGAAGLTLVGILGYGAYTTFGNQSMKNIKAMGMRVTAQFGIAAIGIGYYLYSTGNIVESIGKWRRGEKDETFQHRLAMSNKNK